MEAKKSNLFFLVIIVLLILAQIFLSSIFNLLNVPEYLWTIYVEFGILFIPSIIYIIISKKSIKETLRLKKIGIKSILMIIMIGILAQPLVMFLGTVSQLFFHNHVSDALQRLNFLGYFGMIGLIAITPAICEETVMRGVVLSGYRKVDIKKAALINGFLFGLFHLGPQQFLYAFALGAVFVYLVEITGSIFASMLCHFVINGLQVTLSWVILKVAPESARKPTEFTSMPINIIVSILIVLFIAAIIFTILMVMVIKELEIENGDRLKRREIGLSAPGEKSKKNSVMNWPIYVTIGLYFGFLILAEIVSKSRI